ncbi:hypothetical protein B0J18DRAFT_36964 [Chaetomium sp. MPI-SDFR-AT-0129]|nr:hypothetical protein B0J18DRAFT_36964 [Chaetomium sp. MPI-SDFR-AT-0129]
MHFVFLISFSRIYTSFVTCSSASVHSTYPIGPDLVTGRAVLKPGHGTGDCGPRERQKCQMLLSSRSGKRRARGRLVMMTQGIRAPRRSQGDGWIPGRIRRGLSKESLQRIF